MIRALFIGRSVLDATALVDHFPGPDGKVKALANDAIPGGSALNAAVTYSYLGGDSTLASSMGTQGPIRSFVVEELERRRVSVRDICADQEYSIPISMVISTKGIGSRMIVNGAGDECSRFHECDDLFSSGFKLIQIDQYERKFVSRYRGEIRAFEGPVILDGGAWKEWSLDFLRLADIPIVSEVFCTGGQKDFAEMCECLGISRWAMTLGAGGVAWRDGSCWGNIEPVPVDAIDTLGAGDIFHGAFCYAFSRTGLFVDALASANRIAAESCTSLGTRSWMHG